MRTLEQRQATLEADELALRRFLEQFTGQAVPMLYGVQVVVHMKTGELLGKAFHSLGSPYRGGVCTLQTQAGLAEAVAILEPNASVRQGYITDASKEVAIALGRPLVNDKDFTLWVW